MKSYFMLSGADAAEFPPETLLKLQRAIKRNGSFIGLELSKTYSLQMRPAKEVERTWYVEFLNTKKLTLKWANLPTKKLNAFFEEVLASGNPVPLVVTRTKEWQSETLYRHSDGSVSGRPPAESDDGDDDPDDLSDEPMVGNIEAWLAILSQAKTEARQPTAEPDDAAKRLKAWIPRPSNDIAERRRFLEEMFCSMPNAIAFDAVLSLAKYVCEIRDGTKPSPHGEDDQLTVLTRQLLQSRLDARASQTD